MEAWISVAVSAATLAGVVALLALRKRGGAGNKLDELKNEVNTLKEILKMQDATLRGEMHTNRTETKAAVKDLADATGRTFESFSNVLAKFTETTDRKFNELNTTTENRLNSVRETLDAKLKSLSEENSRKLDEMRKTVDEKLQESVEKRFNESFKLISERLELVQKGLGEMQSLAAGVGDLKRVLTNVKTRGNLGELQLANILEQCLAPEQYVANAHVKPGSQEAVEFAVKLPDKNSDSKSVLLPIDSKFPMEVYQRLLDAYDGNAGKGEKSALQRALAATVRKCADDIKKKYINPPETCDFAVMFVPTEGLYAEILRCDGLFEEVQRQKHVTVVGPANLVAFLNSLQMGFRTLAIEKRSSEVWNLLGAVKTEFGKFGEVLDKTRERLERAVKDIDSANVRTRAIERKLRSVEALPEGESQALLENE